MSNWYPGGQQSQPRAGGAPYQQQPQQWGGGGGGGPGFSQPQPQGPGWSTSGGGQSPWQQQQQQHPGYYGNMQAGGFSPQQQQRQPVPFQQTGYQTQQQAQFHAMQQQQQRQQQQMAYRQEQQRLAGEQERKRTLEIQKRKLQSIDISHPTTSTATLQIDDLVSLSSTPPHGSPQTVSKTAHTSSSGGGDLSPRPSHSPSSSSCSSPRATPHGNSANNTSPKPTPHHRDVQPPKPDPVLVSSQSKPGIAKTDESQVPNTKETYQKLMQDSLLNLNQPSPPSAQRNNKMAFNAPPVATTTGRGGGGGGVRPSDSPISFSQSVKARAWTAGTEELSGLFSLNSAQGEDDFGRFQSGGGGGGFVGGQDTAQCPVGQTSSMAQCPVEGGPLNQGVPLHQGVPSNQGVPVSQGAHHHALVGMTLPTSSYSQPIPATSVCAMDQQGVVSSDARLRSMSTPYLPQSSSTREFPRAPMTSSSQSANLPPSSRAQQALNFSALDASRFPPLYHEVYRRSVKPGEDFVETNLVFPLLVSSQLSRDLLRELWTSANRAVPGRLSRTELFVLLGLIGLAQAGNPSPTLEDLKRAPRPPIPTLAALIEPQAASAPPTDEFGEFQGKPAKIDDFGSFTSMPPISSAPLLPSAPPLSALKPHPPPPRPILPPVIQNTLKQPSKPLLVGASTGSSAVKQVVSVSTGSASSKLPVSRATKGSPLLRTQATKSDAIAPQSSGLERAIAPQSSGLERAIAPQSSGLEPPKGTASSGNEAFADFKANFDPVKSSVGVSTSNDGWANFTAFQTSIPLAAQSSGTTAAKPVSGSVFTAQTGHNPSLLATGSTSKKPVEKQSEIITDDFDPILTSSPDTNDKENEPEREPPISPSLTGLEILDAEMAAKVQASVAEKESQQAKYSVTSDMTKPLRPQSTLSKDDFGDFETYASPTVAKKFGVGAQVELVASAASQGGGGGGGVVGVWRQTLCRCAEVLAESAAVLTSVDEDSTVLGEIAATEEGINKLRGIVEVFRVAKRVYCSMKDVDKAGEMTDCVDSIFKHWKKIGSLLPKNVMSNLYQETAPKLAEKEESDVLSDTISKCSICLMSNYVFISSFNAIDDSREEYHLPLAFHQGQSYHASCANFWSNAVLQDLPTLF